MNSLDFLQCNSFGLILEGEGRCACVCWEIGGVNPHSQCDKTTKAALLHPFRGCLDVRDLKDEWLLWRQLAGVAAAESCCTGHAQTDSAGPGVSDGTREAVRGHRHRPPLSRQHSQHAPSESQLAEPPKSRERDNRELVCLSVFTRSPSFTVF